MSHETKSVASLADAWTKNDLTTGTGISATADETHITVHDKMDRRTYLPISDDNEDH
jgi:hypothetical protein